MSKLDDLCAIKIMGWTLERHGGSDFWMEPNGFSHSKAFDWYPSHSVDDALGCLERAYEKYAYAEIRRGFDGWFCGLWDKEEAIEDIATVYCANEKLSIAMCLCSLRAMGVPESEISLAME